MATALFFFLLGATPALASEISIQQLEESREVLRSMQATTDAMIAKLVNPSDCDDQLALAAYDPISSSWPSNRIDLDAPEAPRLIQRFLPSVEMVPFMTVVHVRYLLRIMDLLTSDEIALRQGGIPKTLYKLNDRGAIAGLKLDPPQAYWKTVNATDPEFSISTESVLDATHGLLADPRIPIAFSRFGERQIRILREKGCAPGRQLITMMILLDEVYTDGQHLLQHISNTIFYK